MIKIDTISLFLGKEKHPLRVNNLTIEKGLWALVGRNGAGKSTFINALLNIDFDQNKNISIDGKLLSDYTNHCLAKKIAIVYSKASVFGNQKALDILFLGRIPYQGLIAKRTKKDVNKVNEIVESLKLEPYINKPFSVLSDGEKQLIMIGRALVQDTPIILLDEPTAFLDVVNRKLIVQKLHNIAAQQNKTIIFSTHNIDLIEQFCDGVLLINSHKMTTIKSLENIKSKIETLLNNEV